MSIYSVSSADVQTRKAWSEVVHQDITTDTEIVSDAVSAGIIVTKDDLSKGKGDEVKFHFTPRHSGAGFIDDQTATGSESIPTYYQDIVNLHYFREVFAIPDEGTISTQRVTFDLPKQVYITLRNWMKEKMVVGTLNQLAGNVASSITYDGTTYTGATELLKITGGNTCTAASTNQIIRANQLSTDTLVAADTTATMSLAYILEAERRARVNRPYIKELEGQGDIKYRLYVHADGYLQMLNDTASPYTMRDIYYNNIAGGKGATMGKAFSQTEIIVTDKVPYGVTSTTADTTSRRAIFCGQEAAALAYGKGFTANGKTTPGFLFKEDTTDVQHNRRISIGGMWGVSKAQFNSIDRGTIAITHYTA